MRIASIFILFFYSNLCDLCYFYCYPLPYFLRMLWFCVIFALAILLQNYNLFYYD